MLDFITSGVSALPAFLDKQACARVLDAVHETRTFGPELFIAEDDYSGKRVGVNPIPGRNLADEIDLSEIEDSFNTFVDSLLGFQWKTFSRKFVVGVPRAWIPDWIMRDTADVPISNLGPYIQPRFHDMTYFHGVDFHQDMIDWPNRQADFVTVYVYLSDTTADSSPLWVVPYSHRFGATVFPHDIEVLGPDRLRYGDRNGRKEEFAYHALTGPAGSVYGWHACVLHGTERHQAATERISLRYLIRRMTPIDIANDDIDGPLSLPKVRQDIDGAGQPLERGRVLSGS